MKKSICIVLLAFAHLAAPAQKDATAKKPEPQIRQYWFVLLTSGPSRAQDSVTAEKIQIGHLNNIKRLYMEGKIKVAGPFGEGDDPLMKDWQGIFVFDCPTKDELEKLLNTDPAISAGRMVYHIKPWYTVPTGSFEPGKPKAALF
jgi:uncharacterized protein YciI